MTDTDRSTDPDLQVPARYYQRLVELLKEDNILPEQVLAPAGLALADITDADAGITMRQVERLVDTALTLRQRPGLGLDLGKVLKLTSHSMVGFGILSSPNVDYALRLAARYFSLIMPSFRMRFHSDSKQAEIVYEPLASMSQRCLDFHLETIAVATHIEARELLQGDMPSYELHLSYAIPAHARRYEELREARCHFGSLSSPGISMRFPPAIASKPLALADNTALKMAESRCRTLASKVIAKRRVAGWVGMMLREASDGMPNLEELARTLNLSSRTLDRHLQREGEGFRDLRKRIQFEKACDMLGDEALSITHIAHELGYSDAANFTRAFRREAGISPQAWREQHLST